MFALKHIRDNKEDYIAFIEKDDESFDGYLQKMAKDGAWAGQVEIRAICQYLEVNILLH